jgi:YegS/Rv2252/BmrU family lipid kinase
MRAAGQIATSFRRQGWIVDVVPTERPGHASALAAAAANDGVRRVVAVGGDGTVHEVANGLLAARAESVLGVVPMGSGNDFAKLTGVYGHGPARAAVRVAAAKPRRFDVGHALGEYFVNSMGFGFGPAVVSARMAMPRLRGGASYFAAVVRAFFGFRAPSLDVRAVEHSESGNMMMIEVCNGTNAGGAYRFAPAADPSDGRLDVCLVRRVGLARFLFAIPRVMSGTHETMQEVTSFRTTELVVRSPNGPLQVHLDGELRQPATACCTVTVAPARLNVLVAE